MVPPIPPIIVHWLFPEKVFYQEWEFWLTIFTFALAGLTSWLAFETRGLRLDSARSIRAAETTAAIALRQLRASLQPMLQLKLEGEYDGEGGTGFWKTVKLAIRNVGTSSVKLKHLFVVIQASDGGVTTDQYEVEIEEFQQRILLPQEEVAGNEIVSIHKREHHEAVYGLHVNVSDLADTAEHNFYWHPTRGTRYSSGSR